MRFLFLFLDGVGLGEDDARSNPLAKAALPFLTRLLGGHKLVRESVPFHGSEASLLALDAGLGISGLPQSATGQAVLLTGRNIPAEIGYHYGPKPNPEVASFLQDGTLLNMLRRLGMRAGLLNAYPPGYFQAIESGRRLYSAIPQAFTAAGMPLKTMQDLFSGRALSADFTGRGWREKLDLPETPLLEPEEAGQRLARLTEDYDFAFFEYWLTDFAGHRQDMDTAIKLLEQLDRVLNGLVESWNAGGGLILVTSDHGNLEDLSTRRHTNNPVPGLIIGAESLRRQFITGLHDLTNIAPAILSALLADPPLPPS